MLFMICFLVAMLSTAAADQTTQQPVPSPAQITTTPADSTQRFKSRADTVVVIKHEFNHKEQIIGGSVIMACLVGILAVMNNYNPH
jgi:hypothetical protein